MQSNLEFTQVFIPYMHINACSGKMRYREYIFIYVKFVLKSSSFLWLRMIEHLTIEKKILHSIRNKHLRNRIE